MSRGLGDVYKRQVLRQNDKMTKNDRKNMLSCVFNGYRHNDRKTKDDRMNILN